MNEIVLFLTLLVLGFSLLLFTVSLISFLKVRGAKTALLSTAFGFFALKEVFTLYVVMTLASYNTNFLLMSDVFDLAVLFFFYAAVFK